MSFGAGPRVCVGETLAMTRLFLWITTLVNRFEVAPAKGNNPSTLDTKQFYYIGVLRPVKYEVIFSTRKTIVID
jgi:cytochrome P450